MEKPIFEKYKIFLRRRGISERTFNHYIWMISKFFEYTDCKLEDFGDLKKFQFRYDKIILKESLCNETKKKHLKVSRIFADFLIGEEVIFENAPRKIKPPKVQTRLPIPIEDCEIYDIFNAIQKRWSGSLAYRNRIIVETFLNTGLRRNELVNLRREDVKKDFIVVKSGKGNKDRIVYINPVFYPVLEDYLKKTDGASEYVFFSLRSKQISPRAMSAIFEAIKKETNITELYTHKMRHTYASRVLESGINIGVLRDQLGHTNIATTNRYIAVRNLYRQEAMKGFKPY